MDIHTATENASKGKLLPVYLLAGDERLLITRCADAVRRATVGEGPRGLSEDIIDARSGASAIVMSACRTLPMMSKRRLVTLRGFEDLRGKESENLLPYLDKPEPSTVLLIVAPGYNMQLKFALAAKEKGFLIVAKAPSEGELVPWIEREAQARGVALEVGAAESLALSIGPELGQIGDALERLQLYAGGGPITTRAVDEVVTPVREVPAWDLAEAVGQRNMATCLAVLGRLAAQRQHALPTLGMVARQVHQIARAREWLDAKAKDPKQPMSLAQVLKSPPFVADKIAAQAKRWAPSHVHRALRILAATDMALKGAKRGDERVMEECVMALCGAGGMGEAPLRG